VKVLVTGANGFVGSYVVRELLEQHHTVTATSLDILTGKRFDWFDLVEKQEADISHMPDDVYGFFGKPDHLIHLAWGGLPDYKELFHIEKNFFESYFFIKKMIEGGLCHFSVIGTCLECGMKEGCLTEGMSTVPVTSYGLAKDSLRKFIEQLQKKFDFEFKWIRLFYLYGEGQSPNSIFSQLEYALANKQSQFNMSGGQQLRDYLPVEKVAQYITKIAQQHHTNGIINCCSGTPVSIKKLVEDYLQKNQKSIHLNLGYYPYPDYEPMAFWGDVTKLKIALGENG